MIDAIYRSVVGVCVWIALINLANYKLQEEAPGVRGKRVIVASSRLGFRWIDRSARSRCEIAQR